MKKLIAGAVLALVGWLVALELPSLRRYIKFEKM
jgi:hypothetical protein